MSPGDAMKLTFGVDELDQLLTGFQLGQFIVFYGSRLGHILSELLCVRCQLPLNDGGLDTGVVFADGGNAFDPYTVSFFARTHGLDPRGALERIYISRAFTAYQLTSLILEKLQEALRGFGSKFAVISDISRLFLDRDVPKIEAREIFNSLTLYLRDFASKNSVIVLATDFPHNPSRRGLFLESALHGRANILIKFRERSGILRFILEKHPVIEPGYVDLPLNSWGNAITLEDFVEV